VFGPPSAPYRVGAEPAQVVLAGVDLGFQVVDQRQRGGHVASPRRGQVKAGKQRPTVSAEQVTDWAGMPKRQHSRVDAVLQAGAVAHQVQPEAGPLPLGAHPRVGSQISGTSSRRDSSASTCASIRSVLHPSGASPSPWPHRRSRPASRPAPRSPAVKLIAGSLTAPCTRTQATAPGRRRPRNPLGATTLPLGPQQPAHALAQRMAASVPLYSTPTLSARQRWT
jgi:hypothetical protein